MDIFLQLTTNKNIIQQLNACHLYLQDTLLSDIVSTDGGFIIYAWYTGTAQPRNFSKHLYPFQDKPNCKAWSHWRRSLSTLMHLHSLTLISPLQEWTKSGSNLDCYWPYLYVVRTKTIYTQTTKANYAIYRQSNSSFYEPTHMETMEIPHSAIPITPQKQNNKFVLTQYFPRIHIPNLPPSSTFHEYLQSLDPWEENLLHNVQTATDIFSIATRWASSTPIEPILCTTDGSAPEFFGSFGWIIDMSLNYQSTYYGRVEGYRISSFRAECYGLLSVLCIVHHVCKFMNTQLPHLVVYIDSKGVLKQVRQLTQWTHIYPNHTLIPEYDVLQAIVTKLHQYHNAPKFQHVKSHQDAKQPYADLLIEAKLNVDADALAAQEDFTNKAQSTKVTMIPGSATMLHLSSGTVTSNLPRHIRTSALAPSLQNYMKEKQNWDENIIAEIDWMTHQNCLQ